MSLEIAVDGKVVAKYDNRVTDVSFKSAAGQAGKINVDENPLIRRIDIQVNQHDGRNGHLDDVVVVTDTVVDTEAQAEASEITPVKETSKKKTSKDK